MQQYKIRDVSQDVKRIVRFVQENCEKVGARVGRTAQQNRLTLNMLVDIFLGTSHTRACNEMHFLSLNLAFHAVRAPNFYFDRDKIC